MFQEYLFDTLYSLSTERKTGHLYISFTENSSINFGTFELKDGELVGAAYLDKSGKDAVSAILEINGTEMRFMVANVNDREDSDNTPTMGSCLQQLQTKIRQLQVEQNNKQMLGDVLQLEVTGIFLKFYGVTAERRLKAIAKEHPPEERPVEFLDRCKSSVAQKYSNKIAEENFSQLYENVKTA